MNTTCEITIRTDKKSRSVHYSSDAQVLYYFDQEHWTQKLVLSDFKTHWTLKLWKVWTQEFFLILKWYFLHVFVMFMKVFFCALLDWIDFQVFLSEWRF